MPHAYLRTLRWQHLAQDSANASLIRQSYREPKVSSRLSGQVEPVNWKRMFSIHQFSQRTSFWVFAHLSLFYVHVLQKVQNYLLKINLWPVVVAHAFSLILAIRRQRQEDLCKFKASLIYESSSRAAKTVEGNPISKKTKTTKQNQKTNKQTKRILSCLSSNKSVGWKF